MRQHRPQLTLREDSNQETTISPPPKPRTRDKDFAALVKKARQTAGFTQAEAAARAGLKSAQHWQWLESGHAPKRTTIEIMERALGVTDQRLLRAAGYSGTGTTGLDTAP